MLRKPVPLLLAGAALLLSGCASDPAQQGPRLVTSVYPLEFLAREVAGDRVAVSSLTPQGAEPHDLELAPAQVRSLTTAELVLYVSGLQPAVDDAVGEAAGTVVDAAEVLGLEDGHEEHDPAAHDGHDHDGHDHDGDPHFWLDPTLLGRLAAPLAEALAEVDPAGAETFRANAERLAAELSEIDAEYAGRLSSCARDVLVVSHEAYGYLAERHGLVQVGLSGLDPEGEPSPARLREIRTVVAEHHVTTIFTEHLVSPKAAEVLAEDLGVATALLDPLETQVDPEADYRDVMRSNLEVLAEGLGCA